jgi:hypothetical protein
VVSIYIAHTHGFVSLSVHWCFLFFSFLASCIWWFDPCSDLFCISRRWMVVLDRQPGVSFLTWCVEKV